MGMDSVGRSIGRIEGKLDAAIASIGNVASEVKSLRDDFSTMEKGRLSRLEVAFATLETTASLKAKNSAVIWSALISVSTSIVSAIIVFWLTVGH